MNKVKTRKIRDYSKNQEEVKDNSSKKNLKGKVVRNKKFTCKVSIATSDVKKVRKRKIYYSKFDQLKEFDDISGVNEVEKIEDISANEEIIEEKIDREIDNEDNLSIGLMVFILVVCLIVGVSIGYLLYRLAINSSALFVNLF